MIIISAILGACYESLDEARVDKSPSEVVVTDNGGETYYIVSREVYERDIFPFGYEIVVADGE